MCPFYGLKSLHRTHVAPSGSMWRHLVSHVHIHADVIMPQTCARTCKQISLIQCSLCDNWNIFVRSYIGRAEASRFLRPMVYSYN